MHVFGVWAPAATRVDLVLPGLRDRHPPPGRDRLPMRPAAGGWWSLPVPGAGPGTALSLIHI